jgi:transposase-like protein
MSAQESATPRAVPFYCPFCGEQDIRPADPSGYRCDVCDRRWELRLLGVGPGAGEPAGDRGEAKP